MSSDVHTTTANVVFHNPGQPPANPLSGKAVVATTKTPGTPNGNVQGQVTNGPIFSNPA
jgi:hypothetical protein